MKKKELKAEIKRLKKELEHLEFQLRFSEHAYELLKGEKQTEYLPKRFSNQAYMRASTSTYEDFVKWWDEQLSKRKSLKT